MKSSLTFAEVFGGSFTTTTPIVTQSPETSPFTMYRDKAFNLMNRLPSILASIWVDEIDGLL